MHQTSDLQISNEIVVVEPESEPTFTKPSSHRSRRSINLLLESLKVSRKSDENSLETYQQRLKKEIKEWRNIYADHIKVFDEKPPTIGIEALSSTNRAYLDAAPSLQIFHNESLKFIKKTHVFLETEYLPMKEKIDFMLENIQFMHSYSKDQLLNERQAHPF